MSKSKYLYINGTWVNTETNLKVPLGNRIKNSDGSYIQLNSDGTATKLYDANTGKVSSIVSKTDAENMREGNVKRSGGWTLDTNTDFDTWFTGNFKNLDYKYSHNKEFLDKISKYGINPRDSKQWADILEIVGQEEYKGLASNLDNIVKTIETKKLNRKALNLRHNVTVNYDTYNQVTNPQLQADDKKKETLDVLKSQAKVNGGNPTEEQFDLQFEQYSNDEYQKYLDKLKEQSLVTKQNAVPMSKEDFKNQIYNDYLEQRRTGLETGLNKASNVTQTGLYVLPSIMFAPALSGTTLLTNAAPIAATYGMLSLAGNHKESVWIKDSKGQYHNLQLNVDKDGNYVDDLSELTDNDGNPLQISQVLNSKGQTIGRSTNLLNNKYVLTGAQALSMAATRGVGTLYQQGLNRAALSLVGKDALSTASNFYTFTGMEDVLHRKDSDPWYVKGLKDVALGATTTASGLLTGKLLSGGYKQMYNDIFQRVNKDRTNEALLAAKQELQQAVTKEEAEIAQNKIATIEADRWNLYRLGRPVADAIQALPKITVGTVTTPTAIAAGRALGQGVQDMSPFISENFGEGVNEVVQNVGQTAASVLPFHYAGKINSHVSNLVNEGWRNGLGLTIMLTGNSQQGRAPIYNVAESMFGVEKPNVTKDTPEAERAAIMKQYKHDLFSALSPVHRTENGGFRFGYSHLPENGRLTFRAFFDPLRGKVDMNLTPEERTKQYVEEFLDNYKLKERVNSNGEVVEDRNVTADVANRDVYTGRVLLNGVNGKNGLESFGQDPNKITAEDVLNSPVAQMIFGLEPKANTYTQQGYFLDKDASERVLSSKVLEPISEYLKFNYNGKDARLLFADHSSDNTKYNLFNKNWREISDYDQAKYKTEAKFNEAKEKYFSELEGKRTETLDVLENGEFVGVVGQKGEFLNGAGATTANNTTGHNAYIVKHNGKYYSIPVDVFKIGASDFARSHTTSDNKKKIFAQSVALSLAESQGSPEIHIQSAKPLSAREVRRLMRHNANKSDNSKIKKTLDLSLEQNKGGNKDVRQLLFDLEMKDEEIAPMLKEHPEIYESLVKNREKLLADYKEKYNTSLKEAKVKAYGKYEALKKEYELKKKTIKKATHLDPAVRKKNLEKLEKDYTKRLANAKTKAESDFNLKKSKLLSERGAKEQKLQTLLDLGKSNYGGKNIKGTQSIEKSLNWTSSELAAYKSSLNAELNALFTPNKSGKISLRALNLITKLQHPEDLLKEGYNPKVIKHILSNAKVKKAIAAMLETPTKKSKLSFKHYNGGLILRVLDRYNLKQEFNKGGELTKFIYNNL